jgi:purine-binding chemotaxis protein CheW
MDYESYLLFMLEGVCYGLPATAVQEIFFLPALTPVAESGAEVAGVLNLRGHIIPVLDLNACFGKPRKPYGLKHVVIILRLEKQVFGLIVSEVHNVESIATSDITADLDDRCISYSERHLILGLAKYNDDIISLLDPSALYIGQVVQAVNQSLAEAPEAGGDRLAGNLDEGEASNEFLAQFTPNQRMVLRERATGLMQLTADDSFAGLSALAVVSLEGERFALGLEAVHEFTDIAQITPIPCCPPTLSAT